VGFSTMALETGAWFLGWVSQKPDYEKLKDKLKKHFDEREFGEFHWVDFVKFSIFTVNQISDFVSALTNIDLWSLGWGARYWALCLWYCALNGLIFDFLRTFLKTKRGSEYKKLYRMGWDQHYKDCVLCCNPMCCVTTPLNCLLNHYLVIRAEEDGKKIGGRDWLTLVPKPHIKDEFGELDDYQRQFIEEKNRLSFNRTLHVNGWDSRHVNRPEVKKALYSKWIDVDEPLAYGHLKALRPLDITFHAYSGITGDLPNMLALFAIWYFGYKEQSFNFWNLFSGVLSFFMLWIRILYGTGVLSDWSKDKGEEAVEIVEKGGDYIKVISEDGLDAAAQKVWEEKETVLKTILDTGER